MTRVALLKADYVNDDLIADHGDLPDMFRRFLADGPEGAAIDLESFEVRFGQFPELEAFEAILITGSRFSVNDEAQWIDELKTFVLRAYELGTPVIGFCFGHQLLASAFGGRVDHAAAGWNLGLWPVEIVGSTPWVDAGPRQFQALFNHSEQVMTLPPQARLIAGSGRCPVQIFAIDDRILGVQFHPEYSLAYQEAIMAASASVPPEIRTDALRRNALPRADQHMATLLRQFIGNTAQLSVAI